MPSSRLLGHLAEHAVNRSRSVALVCADRKWTYGELSGLAERYAAELTALGVTPRRPVCVPAHKSAETIALLIACFTVGASVLVPSSELGPAALRTICEQARCSHVLTAGADGRPVSTVVEAGEPEGFAPVDPSVAKIVFTTSGSTGTPKIVPVPESGFDDFAQWAAKQFELTADDVSLSYAPLNFDLSLLDVWVFLRLGAQVVLVDPAAGADGKRLRLLVDDHGVTFVQGVPLVHRLLTEDEDLTFPTRTVVFTGEALPRRLLPRVARAFPRARLYNVFGCTETNDSFIHEVDPATAGPRIPIGRPIDGVDAVLIDDDGAVVDGPGTGELLVRTPFQTTGYLERALNDKAFRPAPNGVGGPFYRTGDLATRCADGSFVLEGRRDFQVKVRGIRTNVLEVEAVLAAHPQVEAAAVVAVPDDVAGHRLHAEVERKPGSGLTSLRLRAHGAKTLPRHAIPSTIRVGDAPLPRTSTGKPDRTLIKHSVMEGVD
ncbi:acyl-CoA synthetase (AMP-forming)/AMP-acid ligase II [Saccharothrix saharensis]|uniref:Acyl-CoA synthetase (AMP-forming)/AMP-acid ligase II n=1 Tax=Saccharothrix saharensis TaxID=571190 RepID=A0A543J6P8_9PSEU|nr:AMP-binding protein [Saccharothrix saharensis]TQM78510.1 acyl-CoA synthetase (AMP-forming)/AMP-acid ligase II [Saccharothrix saharensis]